MNYSTSGDIVIILLAIIITIMSLLSVRKNRINPRAITAPHLLQAGMDIDTINAYLEHVSISTTSIYAEVDIEMKAKALVCCEVIDNKR